MVTYATLEEVYALGLGPDAFSSRVREVEAVDPATGVILLPGHGLFTGALLRFVVRGAPVLNDPPVALPAGLSAFTMYEATPLLGSSDFFRVAPVGGSIITSFADAGSGVFSIAVDAASNLMRIAANESANINESLTGNAPPIAPDAASGLYEEVLVGVCARRTAIRGALRLGLANPLYKDSLAALIAGQAHDDKLLSVWLAGRELKGNPPDQTAYPDNGAMAAYDVLPVNWRTGAP